MNAPVAPRTLSRRLAWDEVDASERERWIASLRPPRDAVDVAPIVDAVRARGDEAVRELTQR
ncbi:MAG: hypothetical protein ACXWWL_07410, partial [Candidatus Limnocylindria bacterium]